MCGGERMLIGGRGGGLDLRQKRVRKKIKPKNINLTR